MDWASCLSPFGAVVVAAVAAWYDVRTGRIPNVLCASGAVAGLLIGGIHGGVTGFAAALAGGLVASLVPLLLYRAEAMGGGDVKLLFGLGALLGVQCGLEIESVAFAVGAVQGVVVWGRSGRLGAGLRAVTAMLNPFRGRRWKTEEMAAASRTTIPFAPAILVGTVVSMSLMVTT